MSREKFVRSKPHVNIGLIVGFFLAAFALAAGLTFFYLDMILPASHLLFFGTSSLRDPTVHMARILANGVIYGLLTGGSCLYHIKRKEDSSEPTRFLLV
ncbi:MAG: hypothetical protein ACFFDV_09335 [Candidatus Thorarchaeota archaeon]